MKKLNKQPQYGERRSSPAKEVYEAAKAYGFDRLTYYLLGKPDEKSGHQWRYNEDGKRRLSIDVKEGRFQNFGTGETGGYIKLLICKGKAANWDDAIALLWSTMGEKLPPVPHFDFAKSKAPIKPNNPCDCGLPYQHVISYPERDKSGWTGSVKIRLHCPKCPKKKYYEGVIETKYCRRKQQFVTRHIKYSGAKNQARVKRIKARKSIYGLYGFDRVPAHIYAGEGEKVVDYLRHGLGRFAINYKDLTRNTVFQLTEAGVSFVTLYPDLDESGIAQVARVTKILNAAMIGVAVETAWKTSDQFKDIADALDAQGVQIYWGRS